METEVIQLTMEVPMQVGGLGNGHDTYTHQVTDCIHGHADASEQGGVKSGINEQQQMQQPTAENVQEQTMNLMSYVRDWGNSGKKLLQKIWGESKTAEETSAEKSGAAVTTLRQNTTATGNATGVKTAISTAAMENAATHTYFQPVEPRAVVPETPAEKVRYQVQKIARKLMDRLPKRFLGSHSGDFLQTKQQHTKEDLRKRSQYKENDQEIECILTDESYLTDSYNRKGEYSHLTTDKK